MSSFRWGALEIALAGGGYVEAKEFVLIREGEEGPMYTEVVFPLVK